MVEETVGFDEKTAAFIKATDYVKRQRKRFLKDVVAAIGMNEDTNSMIRAKRRKVNIEEIEALVKVYPETDKFFKFNQENTSYENQTLHEPMGTHFYGKQHATPEPWKELVETQKKLIEKLEAELAYVKGQLKVVEAERKTLIEIVSQRK